MQIIDFLNNRDLHKSIHADAEQWTKSTRIVSNPREEVLLITNNLVEEVEDGNEDEGRLETILLMVMLIVLHNDTPKLIIPTPIPRATISFESFYDDEYKACDKIASVDLESKKELKKNQRKVKNQRKI
eukprot:scaffold2041_cov174-Ochromonas_danica.AAC.13